LADHLAEEVDTERRGGAWTSAVSQSDRRQRPLLAFFSVPQMEKNAEKCQVDTAVAVTSDSGGIRNFGPQFIAQKDFHSLASISAAGRQKELKP
jgi:hypothetical protein